MDVHCSGPAVTSTADENENRIREVQMSPCSNDRMGGFDWIKQDLTNNNKEDHDKTGFEIMQSDCMEAVCDDEAEVSNSIDNLSAELPLGIKPVKNWEPEMERKLKITSSGTSVEATEDSSEFLSKSLSTALYDTSSESEVNCQQVDRKGLLQTLLNCIQRVTELNDSSSLPHYLHQIAEIYFDEKEYEKAIQFIQLEKLYHEKLLANLAAIQEHWEVKQKAAITRETSEGRSVKALDNDKIVKLTEFCASHSRPNIPVNEISLLAECFYKNECHFPSEGGTCTKVAAECHSSFTDQPVAVSRVQSAKCDGASLEVTENRRKKPTESVQTALTADKVCEGVFAMYDAESLLEGEIEAARAKGMMLFDVETEHLYSENTVTDKSCFQQHATAPCKDMLIAAKTIETEGFSKAEVVINTTPLFHAEETENLNRDLQFAGKTTEENAQTNLLECNKSIQFITDGQAVPKQSNHAFQKHVKSDPNDHINTEATSRQNTGHSEGSMRIDDQATQNQTDLLNEINECEQMSEKVGSKVEEEIQHSAEFNENLMAHDILEKQEEDGNVEALCSSPWDVVSSSQKNDLDELAVQLNDNSHSLDELAKRIQIEENTHPEGLVSILKKSSNKEISRVQQKQSKRRVRFQEPQDTLDQDEDSGDSCLLLVLLCVITVFLSVGGTALYCTFGDLESSVCRDFTAQMNFYYAQFQQGIEKAKHWLLFS
ncbi:consortin isoform X2 [Heterodontus francisci]|uniref:consortin isoform X2 n=1 Tax=Heterodontus francisci TaxID=7792 RepID=UPI00355B92B1